MDVIRNRLAMHNPHRPKVLLQLHLGKKQNAARLQLPEIWPIYWPFPAGITLQQGSSVVFSDGSARAGIVG